MQAEDIQVEFIRVGARKRALDPARVSNMADSIREIGLRTPLTVRVLDEVVDEDGVVSSGVPVLVAGNHRLAAVRQLGWETVPCIVLDGDERDARLWEIAENLHRAELSAVERAEHIDEWRKLALEKTQPASKGPGRPSAGHHEAAESLGVSHDTVRRAEKIAALPENVRDQARAEDWSQERLLNEARQRDPAPPKPSKPAPAIKNAFESEEDWRRALFTVWNRGAQDWRDRALETMDAPVFERTAAGRR